MCAAPIATQFIFGGEIRCFSLCRGSASLKRSFPELEHQSQFLKDGMFISVKAPELNLSNMIAC